MPMVTYDSKHDKQEKYEKYDKQETQKKKHKYDEEAQTHNHEFLGSTMIAAEKGEEAHNHRFAGVTGEVIFVPGGHVHTYQTDTDFFDHIHGVGGTTGLQVPVGGGKHVHFDADTTTFDDCHDHDFQFATLIDSPLVAEC